AVAVQHPVAPAAPERGDPRLAARVAERRPDHGGDEAPHRFFEHRALQLLLRLEVREQAALRELELVGQHAERDALETDRARFAQRGVDDLLAAQLALAHAGQNSTTGRFVKPWRSHPKATSGTSGMGKPGRAK